MQDIGAYIVAAAAGKPAHLPPGPFRQMTPLEAVKEAEKRRRAAAQ